MVTVLKPQRTPSRSAPQVINLQNTPPGELSEEELQILVDNVYAGNYGNGQERIDQLQWHYDQIQSAVNFREYGIEVAPTQQWEGDLPVFNETVPEVEAETKVSPSSKLQEELNAEVKKEKASSAFKLSEFDAKLSSPINPDLVVEPETTPNSSFKTPGLFLPYQKDALKLNKFGEVRSEHLTGDAPASESQSELGKLPKLEVPGKLNSSFGNMSMPEADLSKSSISPAVLPDEFVQEYLDTQKFITIGDEQGWLQGDVNQLKFKPRGQGEARDITMFDAKQGVSLSMRESVQAEVAAYDARESQSQSTMQLGD